VDYRIYTDTRKAKRKGKRTTVLNTEFPLDCDYPVRTSFVHVSEPASAFSGCLTTCLRAAFRVLGFRPPLRLRSSCFYRSDRGSTASTLVASGSETPLIATSRYLNR
jgi:hypothetical protein